MSGFLKEDFSIVSLAPYFLIFNFLKLGEEKAFHSLIPKLFLMYLVNLQVKYVFGVYFSPNVPSEISKMLIISLVDCLSVLRLVYKLFPFIFFDNFQLRVVIFRQEFFE